jgi:hypothetical protein
MPWPASLSRWKTTSAKSFPVFEPHIVSALATGTLTSYARARLCFSGVSRSVHKEKNMSERDGSVVRPGWRLSDARWSFWASNDLSRSVAGLRWSWRATARNGVVWKGDEVFPTLLACRSDAATHGFDTKHV